MRIEVDRNRCVAIGNCEALAPNVFQVMDSGEMQIMDPHLVAEDLNVAQRAVDMCPTAALRLIKDD